jgi:hypothetical protein
MIDAIVQQLQAYRSVNVFNPWADLDKMDALGPRAADARVSRLEAHFDCEPMLLLVGEAPGYQGCHFSGVPFTNEKLILDCAVPRVTWRNRITTRPRPWCEPSATIVWRTLHRLGIADTTVMWNCFAWHPHEPGEYLSNRAPTKLEIYSGLHVLKMVVCHFERAQLIAVGRLAEHTLKRLGLPCKAVRHPSMGGANDFANGLARLCQERTATSTL